MDLSPQDAMSIVTEMKRTIGRDVNIIENTGVILASTNKARIGTVHEGARQLIENGLDSFTVWADDPARGVQHGINLPVVLDGHIECVIGVTGDPAEVSVFGAVIRRLMEIMLESLRQRRRLAQMDSARDAFLEALFFENSLSPAELAERGQLLGFVPESACTAVLLRPVAETGAEALAGLSGQTLLANIRRTDLPGKGSHCAILRGELAALLCGVGRREAGTFVRRLCAEAESLCGAAMAAGIGDTADGILSARRSFREARGGARGVRVQRGRTGVLLRSGIARISCREHSPRAAARSGRDDVRRVHGGGGARSQGAAAHLFCAGRRSAPLRRSAVSPPEHRAVPARPHPRQNRLRLPETARRFSPLSRLARRRK